MTAIPASQLRSFIDRVEHLEENKSAIATDIKDVYSEAKSYGYDVPTMRKVVARRKAERENQVRVEEAAALLDLYLNALEQPVQSATPSAPRSNVTAMRAGAAA